MPIIERAATEAKQANGKAKPSPASAPPGDWVVSTKEIASWIGVTRQVIDDFANRGVLMRGTHGRWPLRATLLAAFAHYRVTAAGRGPDNTGELVTQRARLARAQSEALERKNAHDAGKLIDIDEVIEHVTQCNRQAVQHILSIPSQCAVEIAGCNTPLEVRNLLDRLLREALENLSDKFGAQRRANGNGAAGTQGRA